MTNIRSITPEDRIKQLYSQLDTLYAANIIALVTDTPSGASSILDDVEALLADPIIRPYAETVLQDALKHIAAQFVGTKQA